MGSRLGNEGEDGVPVDPMLRRASEKLRGIAREVCVQPLSQCSGSAGSAGSVVACGLLEGGLPGEEQLAIRMRPLPGGKGRFTQCAATGLQRPWLLEQSGQYRGLGRRSVLG